MCTYIRPLNEKDLPSVRIIEQQAHSHPWSLQYFQQGFNNPTRQGFGYFNQSELVGFVWLSVIVPESEILNIAVAPSMQGMGIGRALMKAILKQLRLQGVSHFYLEVRASNYKAIHLYQSLGFVQSGLRKDYYQTEHQQICEDALLMQLVY
jgi:ribosomal-protein-alanine N-acetyltransferase